MYSMIRSLPARNLALRQIPAISLALVTSELFFKFGSFSLECLAFLATWFLLDGALGALAGRR